MVKYAMYFKGGSIGEKSHQRERAEELVKKNELDKKDVRKGAYIFYMFLDKNDLDKVKRYNKMRSPGEKSYYKLHYKLFILK